MSLPPPSPDALAHSDRLAARLRREIEAAGGWMSFARYMELALYAPGLGYYAAGAQKFGAAGDFVTAPELSDLFGRALAVQVAEVLAQSTPHVIEAGAGSGRLAADLLLALEALGHLPERYDILDLSPDLIARQRNTIATAAPHLVDRVCWLDTLPERFSGVLIGNEVLDAMPAHLVRWSDEDGTASERGVAIDDAGRFAWAERALPAALTDDAARVREFCALSADLAPGQSGDYAGDYLSELSPANRAWVSEWSERLDVGALILIDYGFPRSEYYHPQRAGGTLMCHYRHHAHGDPFYLPGLQDITVHVDFTTVAEAAFERGLSVLGYTAQSHFLLNCGILDLAQRETDPHRRIRDASALNQLLSPAEMGELFKVIAVGRGLRDPLLGFVRGDRTARL
jgi:SAM-dependent MidA family methyltransferase